MVTPEMVIDALAAWKSSDVKDENYKMTIALVHGIVAADPVQANAEPVLTDEELTDLLALSRLPMLARSMQRVCAKAAALLAHPGAARSEQDET